MIFNEKEFDDFYEQKDLITDAEKDDLIEFHFYDSSPAIKDLDDVKNAWMQLPFKEKKANQKTQNIKKNQDNVKQNETKITENVKKLNEELTSTFSQSAISKMISQQQHLIFTFSSFEARYIDDDRLRFESMRSKNYNLIVDFVD